MTSKNEIPALARDAGLELIRFAYIDNDGVIRAYAADVDELAGDLDKGHPFSIAMPFFSVLDNLTPDAKFGCLGELTGLPDPSTFRIIPWVSHTGMMICDFVRKNDHGPSGLCARSKLKEFLADNRVEAKVAFENEFYLLKKDESGRLVPFDNSLCFATSGMNQQHEVALDIIRALKAQGMKVEKYYPEYGRGQIEIVYKYADALAAADNQVYFRETCRGVAFNHGLTASFMPKPFQHLAGSGAHLHVSLWQNGQNLFYDPQGPSGTGETARFFTGGLLRHLPAICAFSASTVNSYKRLVPHSWASAYVCHGFDNREAAARLCTGMKGAEEKSFNIELKPVDPACNPYLVVLAVLAAGLDGVKNRIDPGPPLASDPHDLGPEERAARGIRRLPETLAEAADALEKDVFFRELLGDVFVEEYLKLKRFAWTEYIRHVSDWEVINYSEAF
ncbi:MAG: glutamine synthetase family protein [Pseudomonadota bacterium]